MKCIIKYLSVTPVEQHKGYGSGLFKTAQNYIFEHGVTDIVLNSSADATGFWEKMGFEFAAGQMHKTVMGLEGIEVPEEINSVPVRVVTADELPGDEDHLFAWYRKSDGAAVAKLRLTFIA